MTLIQRKVNNKIYTRLTDDEKRNCNTEKFTRNSKFLVICICVLVGLGVSVVYFYASKVYHNPYQLSHLPLSSSYDTFNESCWSTYRPHVYIGLKTKELNSPVFGILWFEQPRSIKINSLPLRHWCDQAYYIDNIEKLGDGVKFRWVYHDGRSFGSQEIFDEPLNLNMTADWFNYGKSSWKSRLDIKKKHWSKDNSFIFYFAFQDNITSIVPQMKFSESPSKDFNIFYGNGTLGSFRLSLSFSNHQKQPSISHLIYQNNYSLNELIVYVNKLILTNFKSQDGEILLPGIGHVSTISSKGGTNFIAVQVTVKENINIETHFEIESDNTIYGKEVKNFNTYFDQKVQAFHKKFNEAFVLKDHIEPLQREISYSALSNLLGGVGAWHGYSLLQSQYSSAPAPILPYGPISLVSAVPSRPFFPRGFIWDEGFHHLIIHRFDPKLTLQIISSYLDAMNDDGWIPREIVLDSEARAKIPAEFLIQSDAVANPPMFFYLIEKLLKNTQIVKNFGYEIRLFYPRLKRWYLWLKETQTGSELYSFRWRGRNDTGLQLNPQTLASGLDDYPRATHPSQNERHVDLFCWMAFSSRVLRHLAELFGDTNFMPDIDSDQRRFNDPIVLDELHWSSNANRYCDWGLHSEKVILADVTQLNGEVIRVRKILKPPKMGFVEDVNGYVNLFPMLLKILPPDSPKLEAILKKLNNSKDLWSKYGLRSVAAWSPYYGAWNTRDSGPYWRGAIWINANYLALDALRYYAQTATSSFSGTLAGSLYADLRQRIISTISNEYVRTGTFWEHYNDQTGRGEGTQPFTGWTTLFLSILTEQYD